ncbi:MAG: deoxyribonuclease IV [Chitinivibrionales bacterium]|nr:deoxyribonuclease IV [Chitinivibrionales bacterium]
MYLIGAHVETTGGVHHAPLNAAAIGCKAFGLFTRNQRRWQSPPLDPRVVAAFKENCRTAGYAPGTILAHDSYLINIGSPDREMREKSYRALLDEVTRCELLGVPAINIHPGSHLGAVSEEQCMDHIADTVNRLLENTRGVTIVLENTAGQGSNVGYRFEHLAYMIARIDDKTRIGACLDTCHAFGAGYDLRTPDTWRATLDELDRVVGLRYLRGCHLNDSLGELGARRDRHAGIGKGAIGLEGFRALMTDPRMENIPLILETPDRDAWAEEIALLYSFAGGKQRSPSTKPTTRAAKRKPPTRRSR